MPHLKKPEEPGKEHWRGKQYAFFRHEACEVFPCHPTDDPEDFNCLFCYCPLYALGEGCGGRFTYAYGGVKDCSQCLLPHKRESYGYIIGKFNEIKEIAKKKEG